MNDDPELLDAAPRKVFLDIDPGFLQMWKVLGQADVFAGHDAYVTVGTRVGAPDCLVPTLGIPWIHTLPPVVLEHWPVQPPTPDGAFTSIATWRGPFAPVEFEGETYGLRVHEFRRFLDLPGRTGARFDLALDIDPADHRDRDALFAGGWNLLDPTTTTPDLASYQAFIARSKAELCVAKSMYVKTRSGWFSDRSATYLAMGKPVLAQDTGFGDTLPTGEGLLAFDTLESAVEGVRSIERDLPDHARAARRIAEEHLDSDIVLTRLLRELDRVLGA